MAAAADASRAAQSHRSHRVAVRALVHAAQVVGLVVLLLRALAELPWAAAAAPCILRFAAAFLVPHRLCFVFANIIVIALAVLVPGDAASSSPSSVDPAACSPASSSDGAAPENPFLALFEVDPHRPPTTEGGQPSGEVARAPPDVVVFDDKQAVHVKTKARAQPPRRTMSDKTAAAGAAAGRTSATAAAAAVPELRRAKSENGRRRQRRSAAAATATAELVTDDAEAFRQLVEAFIAKQQTFHREESLVIARAAAGGGGGGRGEDAPLIAAGAAVAVK